MGWEHLGRGTLELEIFGAEAVKPDLFKSANESTDSPHYIGDRSKMAVMAFVSADAPQAGAPEVLAENCLLNLAHPLRAAKPPLESARANRSLQQALLEGVMYSRYQCLLSQRSLSALHFAAAL